MVYITDTEYYLLLSVLRIYIYIYIYIFISPSNIVDMSGNKQFVQ